MAKVEFQLNREGVRQLLRSPEMADICEGYASTAWSRLGDGYDFNIHFGRNRVNAEVIAVTYQAKSENLKNNSILKAVRG